MSNQESSTKLPAVEKSASKTLTLGVTVELTISVPLNLADDTIVPPAANDAWKKETKKILAAVLVHKLKRSDIWSSVEGFRLDKTFELVRDTATPLRLIILRNSWMS